MVGMMALVNLFGRSPFAPLKSHMQKVVACVHCLPELFEALKKKEYDKVEKINKKISKLEHSADLTKNDIRNHLPKSLFMPIERRDLLEILKLQDSIADSAEDVGVLTTLKQLEMPKILEENFQEFLNKNLETFNEAEKVVNEIHDLLESSFGGVEADKVREMVDKVAHKEHEVDLIQRKLLKNLIQAEEEMTYTTFSLWMRIFETIASISNLSEKLAYRIRMTLEHK